VTTGSESPSASGRGAATSGSTQSIASGWRVSATDSTSPMLETGTIVNPKTLDCGGPGIQVDLGSLAGPVAKTVDIHISNHIDNSQNDGPFSVGGLEPSGYIVTGSITSTNPVWKENWYLGDWIPSGPTISVVNPTIG